MAHDFDHHTVPDFDPFMTGGVWSPWLNYSWSIDILLWLGYRWAELAALVSYAMLMAGLVLLICAALVRRQGTRLVRRSFVGAIGFLAVLEHFGPRTDSPLASAHAASDRLRHASTPRRRSQRPFTVYPPRGGTSSGATIGTHQRHLSEWLLGTCAYNTCAHPLERS